MDKVDEKGNRITDDNTIIEALPGNSQKQKEAAKQLQETEIRVKQIDNVVSRNKSIGSSFLDKLCDIGNWIWREILVPSARSTMRDALHEGIDRMVDSRDGGRYYGRSDYDRRRDGIYVSYRDDYYRSSDRRRDDRDYRDYRDDDRREAGRAARIKDFFFKTWSDAAYARDQLIDIAKDYRFAAVKDLYYIVKEPRDYTLENYGWDEYALQDSFIRECSRGFLIDLPNPVYYKR